MKKRLISILLATTSALTLIGCGQSSKIDAVSEKIEESSEDSYVYNISALLSEDNDYDKIILQGFSDALSDKLGEEHFKIKTSTVSEDKSSDDMASSAASGSYDLIFTVGKQTLSSAVAATDSVPIVATGIVDFKGTLRIASLNGKSWDKTTGMNVTGVSSKPSIVDQVSLMIETTDDLQTVGILFSPEDTDSIYQNEIFEAYLDQAGIPWKEYIVPASNTASVTPEQQNSTALTPSKFVAFSAKEGMNNVVESLGDGTNLGLNAPSSTRVATVSDFWKTGKTVPVKETSDEDESEDNKKDSDKDSKKTSDKESKKDSDADDSKKTENIQDVADSTIDERIQEACSECSAIYIPFGSMLTDQMETIGSVCKDSGVVLVAGDTSIGANSLVTLFTDPYIIGYSAGKKAVRVFNGEDIATIKVSSIDGDDSVKLYNGDIAKAFNKEFPKSFKEYHEFLDTYEYGSTITRYSSEENEAQ
ncbi:MAG: hypothetical protein K6D38_01730 [Pseudobutyrivibrio sp.]|nr:hypothetical protein [Pseudobutyrivibrio sp.]